MADTRIPNILIKLIEKWMDKKKTGSLQINFIKGEIKHLKQFKDENGFPTINKNPKSDSFGKKQCAPYPSCWIIWRKK